MMKKILFLNHSKKKCGVYQYGLNVYNAIKKIDLYQFDYAEVSNSKDYSLILKKNSYWAVIYNYHQITSPFLSPNFIKEHPGPISICLAHEMNQEIANKLDDSFFQYYLYGDPLLKTDNPRVFALPRLLFSYDNHYPMPPIPTIGTYGFAGKLKQYKKIIPLVEKEFDQALIRMNIPYNDLIDCDGKIAKEAALNCMKMIKKPGIKLQISHDFFDREGLLDFLAQNSLNVFFYEELGLPGLSSAPDFAISAKRPIAISDAQFFHHLLSIQPSIVIKGNSFFTLLQRIKNFFISIKERNHFLKNKISFSFLFKTFFKKANDYNSLLEILNNGTKPLEPLYALWSETSFIEHMKKILEKIELHESNKPAFKNLNRLLDDSARIQYEKRIQELKFLVPRIMKKKIPRANVQQAFAFDTVKQYCPPSSNILCIGGYHDTAYLALKKQGFSITNIDPEINMDLNTFFLHPKTIKNFYDIIFSISVIEHVEDDSLFVLQLVALLKPGGIGIITCDFKNDYKLGDPLFPGNFRFYTMDDLNNRILPLLANCELVSPPQWHRGTHDFLYENQNYTFATLVFRKNISLL